METNNGYFLVKISKMRTADNWVDGGYGKTSDFGVIHTFKAKNFEEILENIGEDETPFIFENRIELSRYEDGRGEVINEKTYPRVWK